MGNNREGISFRPAYNGKIWHIIPLFGEDICVNIPLEHSADDPNYENIFWDAWYLLGAKLGKSVRIHKGVYRSMDSRGLKRVETYLIAADHLNAEKLTKIVQKIYSKAIAYYYVHCPNEYYQDSLSNEMRKLNFLRHNSDDFEKIMLTYCSDHNDEVRIRISEKTKRKIKNAERQFKKLMELEEKVKDEKKKLARKLLKIINSSIAA